MSLFSKKSAARVADRDELLKRIAIGDAFEYCCFEVLTAPPGYVWPNQFFVANPSAWSDEGLENLETLFSRAAEASWSFVDQAPKLLQALTAHQTKGGTIPEMCALRHGVTVFLALLTVDQAKRMASADPVAAETWLQATSAPSTPQANDPNAGRAWIAELPPQVVRIAETLRQRASERFYPEALHRPDCVLPAGAFTLAMAVVFGVADAGSAWGYSPRDLGGSP